MQKNVKSGFTTVITVDPEESAIHFSSMTEGNRASLTSETKKCRTRLFDEEFFKTFTEMVGEYATAHPSAQAANVTLVLPDRAVATDVLSVPTLRRKQSGESLEFAINDLYKNSKDLKINRQMVVQNKQFATYSLSIMQNSLLTAFYTAFTTCKMIPQAITFAANTTVNAVLSFQPKLANATFLLMDLKPNYTRISFVSKGRTCGFYSLPFGYSILERNRLAAEDMLFDHSQADLLVLNAKEKAKAKQLTMMDNNNSTQVAEDLIDTEAQADAAKQAEDAAPEDDFFEEEENETGDVFTNGTVSASTNTVIRTLPKKQPRKLPKFMLRPMPHDEQGYAYENFRLFVKWALNLIQTNRKMLWQDKADAVYVNLPEEYRYLFDMVNEEKKENGISFLPVELAGGTEKIISNLESFGGFFVNQFNPNNNF